MSEESRRILVVEDEDQIRKFLRISLEAHGYEVVEERLAGAGLESLAALEPCLVILDLGLPDMDGLAVMQQLRTRHRFGLLIVTGRGDTHDRVMGLELGADDYMTKPFEPRELIARVRSILRRYQPEPPSKGHAPRSALFAGWRFDTGTHRLVSPAGTEDTLSVAEAQLLTVLLEHANQILSRDQLLDGRDVCALDRSIDLRISRLRRRLDENPQHAKLIKTVYGAGYLLAATVEWQ